MERKEKTLEIINIIFVFISLIIPSIFFFMTSSEKIKIQTYIIFGIIILALIIGGIISYFISKWKKMGKDIYHVKKDINEMKKDLNFKELWNNMEVRLRVLENILFNKKNKKGQSIDPRIILWILLGILLYLFLKSIGLFK